MKEKLIRIPDKINDVLEQHKIDTGRSITGMLQESLYRWLVNEKLIRIRTISISIQKKKEEEMPNDIKFCTNDKCIY